MVERSMVVADAQVWLFMWQGNWTTVITTKVVKKLLQLSVLPYSTISKAY